MPAYRIVESKVIDKKKYQQYIRKVSETIKPFDGRYLARGNNVIPLFGEWKRERMILLEFPSKENIYRWLSSPEYRAIEALREEDAETQAIILEGEVDLDRPYRHMG